MAEFKPVLLSESDIAAYPNAFGYPATAVAAAIEQKAQAPYRDGVYAAVELLLSESAVSLQFIDITKPGKPIHDEDNELFQRPDLQLGFNDHGGGSESRFKILINRISDTQEPGQYVLYSPPQEDGASANNTFHKANFQLMNNPPNGLFYKHDVPNPLKTFSAASHWDRRGYDFYLIGDANTPARLPEALEAAGFNFDDQPYSWELLDQLRDHELRTRAQLDYAEFHRWPHQQFAAKIAMLRAVEMHDKI